MYGGEVQDTIAEELLRAVIVSMTGGSVSSVSQGKCIVYIKKLVRKKIRVERTDLQYIKMTWWRLFRLRSHTLPSVGRTAAQQERSDLMIARFPAPPQLQCIYSLC